MDLSFFLDKENSEIVGDIRDAIGIYIVSQKELPQRFDNVTRNGAAGTKEVIDARNQSSFKSRIGMYLSNWITDGLIHAALTVPRSIFLGFSQKQLPAERDPRDARPDHAIPNAKTRLQIREKEYHAELERLGCTRARGETQEWFAGPMAKKIQAMRSIGTGTFYDFRKGNVTPLSEVLSKRITPRMVQKGVAAADGDVARITEFDHRRSPRLIEMQLASKDVESLRRGDKRSRAIARALAQLN